MDAKVLAVVVRSKNAFDDDVLQHRHHHFNNSNIRVIKPKGKLIFKKLQDIQLKQDSFF